MSKEYVAMIFIKDEDEEFTKDEIRDMIQENMLEYADNAPFSIRALKVEEI